MQALERTSNFISSKSSETVGITKVMVLSEELTSVNPSVFV